MNNFLSPLHSDTVDIPADFYPALQKSWSRESCWDEMKPQWKKENPSLGNCFVSVLALWAATDFKGEVVPVLAQQPEKAKPDWHFLIRLNGTEIDLTRQQFAKGTEIRVLNKDDPEYKMLIDGSIFDKKENASIRIRLSELLRNLHENGYPVSMSAKEIVDRLEQKFTALGSAAPARGV